MPSFSRPTKAPPEVSVESSPTVGSNPHPIETSHPDSPVTSKQWKSLRQQIFATTESQSPESVLRTRCEKGRLYRWGITTAKNQSCSELQKVLSFLAVDLNPPKKRLSAVDLPRAARELQNQLSTSKDSLSDAFDAVLWAAAMPQLLHHLDEPEWWNLLGALQDFRETVSHQESSRPQTIVAVVELGLTLAWRLSTLPSCRRLQSSSVNAMQDWFDRSDESISNVVRQSSEIRLLLASLIRTKRIINFLERQNDGTSSKTPSVIWWLDSYDEVAAELFTWCVSLLRQDGTQVFSANRKRDVAEDLDDGGLLMESSNFDLDTLGPAFNAALGDASQDGRLAWISGLPESMLHDEEAKLACLLPDWDVRRSRLSIRYDRTDISVEMLAGQAPVISGAMQTHVSVNGETLSPNGEWIVSCEYTDDDVHYLELELPYTGGYVLQRQFMLIREDRCCYVADAVMAGHQYQPLDSAPAHIDYQLRLPLGNSIQHESLNETSEIFLRDRKRRTLVLPLSASEWANDSSAMTLSVSEDRHLLIRSSGKGQLHIPLWFDFYRSRFRLKRTWRNLTVAQNLTATPASDAVSYRIQTGSEQWVLYRSMKDRVPRTFMGKHMIADFYCARFDARKQSYEDLITVDDDLDGEKKTTDGEKGN